MTAKNPVRVYAGEFLAKPGVTETQAAAVAAAVIAGTPAADATGAVFGDVAGGLLGPLFVKALHGDESSKVLTGNTDDLDMGDGRRDDFYWLIDLAGFDVSGFAAPGTPGEAHVVVNTGTAGRILASSGSSVAANQVLIPAGDLTIATDGAVLVLYSGTLERWVLLASQGPAGADGGPGLDGLDGNQGRRGDAGADGLPGLDGMSIRGLPGADGNPGIDGVDGNRGPIGNVAEQDHGTIVASENIDVTVKDIHRLVLGANVALTLSGLAANPVPTLFRLRIVQPAAGGPFSITSWFAGFGGTLVWRSGVAPTLSVAANAIDIIDFDYDSINGVLVGLVPGTTTGPTGNEGLPGMDGNDGRRGDQGIDGLDGGQGPRGFQGEMGIDGLDGNPGRGTGGGSAIEMTTPSGSPDDTAITKIIVPDGTLTIASHVATIRQVPVGMIGAKVYNAGLQALAAGVVTALTFDTEEFDTDSFHDTSANTSRMTIPAGLGGKYLVHGYGRCVAGGGSALMLIRKNGAATYSRPGSPVGPSGAGTQVTTVLDLVAGDYIELMGYLSTGGSVGLADAGAEEEKTTLIAVKLDAGRVGSGVGARVYNSGNIAMANGAWNDLTFDSERFDTDGFHDTSANTGRLTVPAGMGGIYLITGTVLLNTGGGMSLGVFLNSAAGGTAIAEDYATASRKRASISTVYKLNAGDYVRLGVFTGQADTALSIANESPEFSIVRLDQGAFGNLASGRADLTTGNVTTGSTAFTDAAGLSVTLVTGARRCLVTFQGIGFTSAGAGICVATLLVDGVNVGDATWGFAGVTGGDVTRDITFLTDLLSAGSHIFKIQFKASAGSSTIGFYGGNGGGPRASIGVQEMPDSGNATAGASVSQIVRGRINSDGTIAAGTGFTANRTSTGRYTITPTIPFAASPVVIVTLHSTGGASTLLGLLDAANPPTTTTIKVQTFSGGGAANADATFDFIAMSVA